jgi:LysM repeat protein
MKVKNFYCLLGLAFIFALSGCVVRTYQVTKERVDQEITGNQGYLMGKAPEGIAKERKPTRTTQVVEVELHSPIKFEKMPSKTELPRQAPTEPVEEAVTEGNRGYITQNIVPEIAEPEVSAPGNLQKYTVQKGDTLQKISQKFFGTTKKWNKIYELNKDVLKGPNKIYPGQVINVPVEGVRETGENLK